MLRRPHEISGIIIGKDLAVGESICICLWIILRLNITGALEMLTL
jgi:hypothetical protein